ncbi:hypothetical protein AGLY_014280 [Aphis glycines]|uniref:Uncharacterized protein n=1 Tax=Aphis glycines TaxID=307491 RepID=A0A6G0T406_APHGL|nr:hypothetical protein AGLY_014280 [Aphis glycines]
MNTFIIGRKKCSCSPKDLKFNTRLRVPHLKLFLAFNINRFSKGSLSDFNYNLRQVGTALLYIKRWGGPRTRIPLTLIFGENFKGAEVKNRSIFTVPNVVDRHKKKNKNKNKKKTHIIVKSIHSSLRSESKNTELNQYKLDGLICENIFLYYYDNILCSRVVLHVHHSKHRMTDDIWEHRNLTVCVREREGMRGKRGGELTSIDGGSDTIRYTFIVFTINDDFSRGTDER